MKNNKEYYKSLENDKTMLLKRISPYQKHELNWLSESIEEHNEKLKTKKDDYIDKKKKHFRNRKIKNLYVGTHIALIISTTLAVPIGTGIFINSQYHKEKNTPEAITTSHVMYIDSDGNNEVLDEKYAKDSIIVETPWEYNDNNYKKTTYLIPKEIKDKASAEEVLKTDYKSLLKEKTIQTIDIKFCKQLPDNNKEKISIVNQYQITEDKMPNKFKVKMKYKSLQLEEASVKVFMYFMLMILGAAGGVMITKLTPGSKKITIGEYEASKRNYILSKKEYKKVLKK